MPKKLCAILAVLLLTISLVCILPLGHAAGPTIWTNQADYSPGETVTIYGTGFSPRFIVSASVTGPDNLTSQWTITSNSSGSFTTCYQLGQITGSYVISVTDGTHAVEVTFLDCAKNYFASISSNTVYTGQTQNYTINISNDLSSATGEGMGSAQVSIPSGFTVQASSIKVTAPSGKSWTETVSAGQIKLTADTGADELGRGESISVSFSGTAPATAGTCTWTTYTYEQPRWAGDNFHILCYQPTVTVNCKSEVLITITSNPVTGAGFLKVDGISITTPCTFTWTPSQTHTLQAISPVAAGTGVQYVFTVWSDCEGQTLNYVVPQTSATVTANYKTQYYLTVSSSYDSPTPTSRWFDAGTSINASVTSPWPTSASGTRYVCIGWTGTGSVPSSGSGTSTTFTIGAPSSITWNWKTQYSVTFSETGVGSDFTGTVVVIDGINYGVSSLPVSFWFDSCTSHSFAFQSPLVVTANQKQYVWTSTSGLSCSQSGSITVSGYGKVTGNYKTQYYLTVASMYDTPSGGGWYNSGANAYAKLTTGTVNISPGWMKAIFTKWSGDATGTGLTSNAISMNGPKTAIANWVIQYYLKVASSPSSVPPNSGAGWYNQNTTAILNATAYSASSNGVRYRFSYWDVDGTSVSGNPINVYMNTNHTATAHYVMQYCVTFSETGIGSDFTGTVVTINGKNYGAGSLPVSLWYDSGTTQSFSFQSPLMVTANQKRYGWSSTTGLSSAQNSTSFSISASGSVTGNYKTQYCVTFSETGVGSDFTGTVITIGGISYGASGLPASIWCISSTSHSFAFGSPLVVTSNQKQYLWTSTSGLSSAQSGSITVSGYGSVIGTYKTQYRLTISTNFGSVSPASAWYNPGSIVTISATSPSAGSGERY